MGVPYFRRGPENLILPGNPEAQRARAEAVVSERREHCPELFAGNRDCFSFELRYIAPFDRDFRELKRLQGTAAAAAGRRDEFRGYIVIDLSGYLTHEREPYFEKTLLFLADMSECWKYIFLVEDRNPRAARELIAHLLEIFVQANVPCEVREAAPEPLSEVVTLCRALDVTCTAPVWELLGELLEVERFSRDIVSAFLRDLTWRCGRRISLGAMVNTLSQRESVIRYMLSEKEYSRFKAAIERRKENWYGEKEAI